MGWSQKWILFFGGHPNQHWMIWIGKSDQRELKPRGPDCIMSRLADAVRSLLLGLATTTTTTWWRGAEPDLKLALVAGAVEGSGWRAQAARAARARDARILRSWGARIRTASGLGLILYLHQVKDMWGPDRNVSLRWLCRFIFNPFF